MFCKERHFLYFYASMETKGYLQVYTGNGKGKTTAAFGLVVRALCAGKRVFIGQRDTGTEVVITGRYASEALLALADLVTEMREVKHYYTRGVLSRDGFDH